MSSRMDRYYNNNSDDMRRTRKNSKLYDNLYDNQYYDNIENINLNVGKEIDIRDVKDMLDKRESYKELRDYRIVKPEKPVTRKVKYYEDEEQNSHDINEMLGKARVDRPIEEKRRSLEETQVMTLQDLVSKKSYAKKTNLDKEEVKDLIHTIYDTNLLMSNDGGGLLDDLKATGKTVISPSIKQVLEDAKKAAKEDEEMDDSFFTSSLGFKSDDLKKSKPLKDSVMDSDDKTLKFLIILAIVFIIIVLFIIIKFVVF